MYAMSSALRCPHAHEHHWQNLGVWKSACPRNRIFSETEHSNRAMFERTTVTSKSSVRTWTKQYRHSKVSTRERKDVDIM